MLEELGIPYEYIPIRPASKAARTYISTGKIPILLEFDDNDDNHPGNEQVVRNEDDISSTTTTDPKPSFVLSESSAIVTYLAVQYGNHNSAFVPSSRDDDKELMRQRAIYDQAVSCITNELDSQGLWIHQKHEAMSRFHGAIPEAVEHAKQQFDVTNHHLAQQLHPYLLGDSFSAADILYVHCLDWSQAIGWDANWPSNLSAYQQLCQNRPAYQTVRAMRDAAIEERKKHKSSSSSSRSNLSAENSKL
jgi:glutathione S-transferase